MRGGSHRSAWQQKCTQSVCPYVWVGACGCMRVAPVHHFLISECTIICLFVFLVPLSPLCKSEEHKRILTAIYRGFILLAQLGSLSGWAVLWGPWSSWVFSPTRERERLAPGMVKVVDYLAGKETWLGRRVGSVLCENFPFSELWWKLELELMMHWSCLPPPGGE